MPWTGCWLWSHFTVAAAFSVESINLFQVVAFLSLTEWSQAPSCRNVRGFVRSAGRVGASPIALVQRGLVVEHSLQELKAECWYQCEENLLRSLLDAQ